MLQQYNQLSVASPPTDVRAVQDGPTSIIVSWTPPFTGDIAGYRISYAGDIGGFHEYVFEETTNRYSLIGLMSGETYTIAVSSLALIGLPSTPVEATAVGLGKLTINFDKTLHNPVIP